MNQRRHLSLVAAAATLMAAAPLDVLFTDWSWLVVSVFVIGVVCAVSMGTRALRLPVWAQPLAGVVAVLVTATLLTARTQAIAGLIPGPAAWTQFGNLLSQAGSDIRTEAIPVDSDQALLMVTALGIGLVAVLVDLLAVGLRRPATAGLPMLAVYAVPVAISQGAVGFVYFAITAAGYLWLLVTDNVDRVRVFGRRFTGEGKGVDMWEPSPLAAVGRRIAVGCVALAILLPVVTPGFSTALVGVLGTVPGSGNGTGTCKGCTGPNTVDLLASLAGQLNQNNPVTMAQLTTDDSNPEYLRFAVATQLTNRGFLTVAPTGQPLSDGLVNPYANSPGINYADHQAAITIGNLSLAYLPIYTAPVTGSLNGVGGDWRFDIESGEIFTTTSTRTTQGMKYSFNYTRPTYDPNALRTAQPLPENDPLQKSMTTTPEQVKEVQDILNNPATQANNEYDRVLKLYKWFSSAHGFTYSTSTKPGTTGTDIGNFLKNRAGYCVQYAAALAWLVRAAGYPARVALGFAPGNKDDNGVWTLTNKDLHAWTEVYFNGYGWVPFDATPTLGGTVFTLWAPDPNQTIGPSSSSSAGAGDTNVPVNPGRHATPSGPAAGLGGTGGHGGGGLGIPWWGYVILLAVLLIAASPFLTRIRLRRRRTSTTGAPALDAVDTDVGVLAADGKVVTAERRRVHAVWEEFVDTLVDYGFDVDPTETPRAAADRMAKTSYIPEQVATDVRRLGQAEERARYARLPGSSPSFTAAIRRIRRAFAARAPWRIRLRAQFFPPSVTSRWREATVSAFASASAATQSVMDAIVRTLNVRARLASSRR